MQLRPPATIRARTPPFSLRLIVPAVDGARAHSNLHGLFGAIRIVQPLDLSGQCVYATGHCGLALWCYATVQTAITVQIVVDGTTWLFVAHELRRLSRCALPSVELVAFQEKTRVTATHIPDVVATILLCIARERQRRSCVCTTLAIALPTDDTLDEPVLRSRRERIVRAVFPVALQMFGRTPPTSFGFPTNPGSNQPGNSTRRTRPFLTHPIRAGVRRPRCPTDIPVRTHLPLVWHPTLHSGPLPLFTPSEAAAGIEPAPGR
ncbi:hypothetical protein B0H16DRAFT_1709213 [Mycena metata]|uniref:Uncharacterized protein n=1 Tax=Mycena metata TaxID=1033252 RepID=A0AAD7KH23_9AGAR|nr:hypothetical protein B0H16DRAFT_1709213 [Mycena metata]